MSKQRINRDFSSSLCAAWLLCAVLPILACSSSALTPTGEEAVSQNIITREDGLQMVARFASSDRAQLRRAVLESSFKRPLAFDERYQAAAVQQVLHQSGAARAFASLGRNANGSTTVVLRVLDEAGQFLPKALANGKVIPASDAEALVERLQTESDDAGRALVTASDGTVIRGWKYDAKAFGQIAEQRTIANARFALGQNTADEPTIVMLAEDRGAATLSLAGDQGMPSPPY
jgi:hypothetical protein